MGGVETDVHGRTSLPGLYAAGEVACTGVHGANRLASNSLLEGLVFGALAAEAMAKEAPAEVTAGAFVEPEEAAVSDEGEVEAWIRELRELMWKDAGLLRDREGLLRAQVGLAGLTERMPRGMFRRALEARSLHEVAVLIVASALGREESRGAHYRSDFPGKAGVGRHSRMCRGVLEFV